MTKPSTLTATTPPTTESGTAVRTQLTGVQLLVGLFTILVVGAAVTLVLVLVRTVVNSSIPFDTDEANHAVDSWEVFHALANGGSAALIEATVAQGFYPPVHSFFVAASYALGGAGLAASRMPSVLNFVLSLILLAGLVIWLGHGKSRLIAVLAAAFAVGCAISSGVFVANAVLTMLELTGALLGLVLLWVVHRLDIATQPGARQVGLVAATVIVMVIALTKYSFGLFFLAGLVMGLVSGGLPWLAPLRAWRDVALVSMVAGVVAVLWLMVTDQQTLWLFFTDHPEYAPILSAQNLLYLLQIWLTQYTATHVVAILLLILAVIGAVQGWQRLAVRVATWSVVAGGLMLTISTTNEARHSLPLAPLIWLLAGLGLVSLLEWLHRQRRGATMCAVMLLGLLGLMVWGGIRQIVSLPTMLNQAFEGVAAHSAVHEYALRHVTLDRPVLLIGDLYDQNNLLAIRWRAGVLTGKSLWALDLDYFPFEHHESSLARTGRKPQIATVDPTFPRQHMSDVLARAYYAYVVEIKDLSNYHGPRAANPDDPLCGFATQEARVDGWIVIVYATDRSPANCSG